MKLHSSVSVVHLNFGEGVYCLHVGILEENCPAKVKLKCSIWRKGHLIAIGLLILLPVCKAASENPLIIL